MNLDKQRHLLMWKYAAAVAKDGENSKVAKYLHRELVAITCRIFRRNNRKRKVA